jgi:hypothetical protein
MAMTMRSIRTNSMAMSFATTLAFMHGFEFLQFQLVGLNICFFHFFFLVDKAAFENVEKVDI